MDEVEKVARAMAKAEGLDFDEVCGSESGDYECDSGTCIAAYHEDHDADAVRYWYLKLSKAAIAALDEARGDPVAKVVAWLRNGGGTDISKISGSAQMMFLEGMNRYADAIERGEPFNG